MKAATCFAACVLLAACMAGGAAAQAANNAAPNFWAAINANSNLKSMAGFVTGDTRTALQNPRLMPYTIFAPTDEAFNRMLNINIPGVNVRSFMNNRAVLNMVLNIHLVPGTWTTSKLKDGQTLQSRLAGTAGQLTVSKKGGEIRINSAGSSPKIIQPDVMAGNNGVMHVIDGMLLPVRLPTGAGRR